jgi:hypothetical protein
MSARQGSSGSQQPGVWRGGILQELQNSKAVPRRELEPLGLFDHFPCGEQSVLKHELGQVRFEWAFHVRSGWRRLSVLSDTSS